MESKLRLLLQEEAFPDTATAIRLRFDVSTSGSTNGVSLRRDYRFAQPMEGRNREKKETILCQLHLVSLMEQKRHTRVSSQQTFKTVYFL